MNGLYHVRCIAAGKEIINHEVLEIGNLLSPFTAWFNKAKPGDIFDCPDGVEFEELRYTCNSIKNNNEIECVNSMLEFPDCCGSGKTIIRLKLKEEVKPVESQYDLWAEAVYICMMSGNINELKSKFTIQRNKI